MPFETFKHCFYDLTQVAFWDGQEAENEFKVTCEPLKHRFSTSIKLHFGIVKRRKCVQSAMRALETSHFGWSGGRKCSQCQATT